LEETPEVNAADVRDHAAEHERRLATLESLIGDNSKVLIGSNVLTSCLTRSGWMIWKSPPLDAGEIQVVNEAVLRFSGTIDDQGHPLLVKGDSQSDPFEIMRYVYQFELVSSNALLRLASDLKAILPASPDIAFPSTT